MEQQLPLQMDEADVVRPLWERALRRMERRLGREAIQTWLRDAEPLSYKEGVLVIAAPNGTARDWIEKKYGRALAEVFGDAQETSQPVSVEVVVRAQAPEKGRKPARPKPELPRQAPVSSLFAPLPLNEKYTFENFVVGQSNRFAHAGAVAVAERPGRHFNPLFIYGGVGLGKTHLLQAIGHRLQEQNPRARVAYVSGETFTSHFITSLRESREEEFRRTYRGVDIWLVDDIQFIADKTSTKEEFFHTFNELYLTNRQIVLAADRPPKELRLMEDRLRSRLESGLMAEIGPPELETRVAILERRAISEQAAVPSDVLLHIASMIETNVRVLEAALIRLLALASLNRTEMTVELADRALQAFRQEGRIRPLDVEAVRRVVCQQFGVSEDELLGERRDKKTSLARQVAMYLLRTHSEKSLSEIGAALGGKAHSTVLYGCQKLEQEMRRDPSLASLVRRLCTQLMGSSNK
ncbi:MAG: chromosomal replication initiator protein DnaA [Armatimonadetes bacterium]|nr:chromosomal replication initiator protein DnaA [Armatimonadota bacterium]